MLKEKHFAGRDSPNSSQCIRKRLFILVHRRTQLRGKIGILCLSSNKNTREDDSVSIFGAQATTK